MEAATTRGGCGSVGAGEQDASEIELLLIVAEAGMSSCCRMAVVAVVEIPEEGLFRHIVTCTHRKRKHPRPPRLFRNRVGFSLDCPFSLLLMFFKWRRRARTHKQRSHHTCHAMVRGSIVFVVKATAATSNYHALRA